MYAVQVRTLGGGWLTLKGRDKFTSLSQAENHAASKRYLSGAAMRVVCLDTEKVVWPDSLAGQEMRPALSP